MRCNLDNVMAALAERRDADCIPIVIPASFTNELGQIRGLGSQGLPVIAADYNAKALGFYSRYSIPYLVADYTSSEEAFVKGILKLGTALRASNKRGVLFIAGAEELLPIVNRFQSDLLDDFIFTSNINLQLKHEDKWFQMQHASKAGLRVPETILWDTKTIIGKPESLSYPVIVKGRSGKSFYKKFKMQAIRCNDSNEVHSFLNSCKDIECLVQEEIPGAESDLFTLGCYMSKNSEVLGIFTGRKIRNNREYGSCAMAISCKAPDVVEEGLNYLKTAGYHGACEIEFKRDERDGKLRFLEINNRLWKWHSLATACGVNLAYLQYLDAIGCSVKLSPNAQINDKRWWLALMDSWVQMKRGISHPPVLMNYLTSLRTNMVHGTMSLSDPLPGIINAARMGWVI